ncbi:alpha-1,2-galactosyltransferase [Schizosaccharomyces japonicus yFS275]|uniref:Alpha-1,2-galactosyltransferase n=1 Tax=Schizosaccharomyces japonicus (strain yFS275 / FY16936) TaxID=402676 RepID=B6K5X0_SCHJY|nr:alpha-1,2-galactosyltransferase [Schizosaccharomyces japonicus yFS275]EEB08924.1 alpha-1,2-galactosyltransferase [Schizosaccharomyces japonicus yFS275]
MRFGSHLILGSVIVIAFTVGTIWNRSWDRRMQNSAFHREKQQNEANGIASSSIPVTTVEKTYIYTQTEHHTEYVTESVTTTSTSVVPGPTGDSNPSPEKVVMVFASNLESHPESSMYYLAKSIVKNRRAYAERHGFKFMQRNVDNYEISKQHAPAWSKIPILREAMNTYPDAEWIWWLDHDALIINRDFHLVNDLLRYDKLNSTIFRNRWYTPGSGISDNTITPGDYNLNDIHLIISQDWNGINAGSMFFRNTKFTRWLLDVWIEPLFLEKSWIFAEQEVLGHMISNYPELRKRVALVSNRLINAYSSHMEDYNWHDGDFCVHFAGCKDFGTCKENFDKFSAILDQKEGLSWRDESELPKPEEQQQQQGQQEGQQSEQQNQPQQQQEQQSQPQQQPSQPEQQNQPQQEQSQPEQQNQPQQQQSQSEQQNQPQQEQQQPQQQQEQEQQNQSQSEQPYQVQAPAQPQQPSEQQNQQ